MWVCGLGKRVGGQWPPSSGLGVDTLRLCQGIPAGDTWILDKTGRTIGYCTVY